MRGAAARRTSGGGGGETGEIVEPLPEELRMERMNANYEHDKAVLAKEDPMFAKNKFWDVGHAEGSGEISNRELEKLATLQSEELLEQIKGRDL